MAKLNLSERRGWHDIEIREVKSGKLRTFKIPTELTVAETEYMLEMQESIDKLQDERMSDDGSAQLRLFFEKAGSMALVMFKRHHPDMTIEYLRENFSNNDLLTLIGFFENKRYLAYKNDAEKKVKAD